MAALTLAFTDPSSLSLDTLLGHYLNGTLWGAGIRAIAAPLHLSNLGTLSGAPHAQRTTIRMMGLIVSPFPMSILKRASQVPFPAG